MRISIENETFTKWRRLRDELQLGNDDAVVCYLLEAEVHSRNERLEHEMLVDSIGLWLCYRMRMLLIPAITTSPIVNTYCSCKSERPA